MHKATIALAPSERTATHDQKQKSRGRVIKMCAQLWSKCAKHNDFSCCDEMCVLPVFPKMCACSLVCAHLHLFCIFHVGAPVFVAASFGCHFGWRTRTPPPRLSNVDLHAQTTNNRQTPLDFAFPSGVAVTASGQTALGQSALGQCRFRPDLFCVVVVVLCCEVLCGVLCSGVSWMRPRFGRSAGAPFAGPPKISHFFPSPAPIF